MRWVLCLLVGSLALSACLEEEVPRLNVFHHVVLAQGFAVRDGNPGVGTVRPRLAVEIDSITTEPGDRWVMSNIVRKNKQEYTRYTYGALWLLTDDGTFYCANDEACAVSAFPATDLRPTEAQLRTLSSALMDAEGFQPVP